jgi:hypothetical protein
MLTIAAIGAGLRAIGWEGALIYGVFLIVLYELFIRWPYTSYEKGQRERRRAKARTEVELRAQSEAASLAASKERLRPTVEREAVERETQEEEHSDPMRKQFVFARKAAEAEVRAALDSARQAEQRRQDLINQESERQRQRIDDEVERGRAPRSTPAKPAQ